MARPSVQRYTSSGTHSDFDVGLLMGMMMGAWLIAAMLPAPAPAPPPINTAPG